MPFSRIKRKTPLRRRSKGPVQAAKAAAWQAFSHYVAYRDAMRTTGTLTHCKCVTCGKVFSTTGPGRIQAGHAISGRNNAILFDEDLVRAQCAGDNIWGSGRQDKFLSVLLDEHGPEWLAGKIRLANTLRQFTVEELDGMREDYLARIAEMKKAHGL